MPPVGQLIFLYGAPEFRHQVLLAGRLARARPTFEFYPDEQAYVRVYHVSGPSPPGTSGGAWVDEQGRLLGIQSARMVDNGPQGIAYLSPLDGIRGFLDNPRDRKTATLGVGFIELWELSEQVARFPPGSRGLIAHVLRTDSPMHSAGLREQDLVMEVDGEPVEYRDDLLRRVRAHQPGELMRFKVMSPGEAPRKIRVRLKRLKFR